LDYLWDFGKTVLVSYLITVLASDLKKLRLIFVTICLSVAFEAAKQGWAQLLLNPGATNTNDLSFFGDNNGVAVGMLMIVPMLIALARTAEGRPERWLHYFLAVGVLYRAIATYSRGGFLAAAALALLYTLRSPHRVRALVGGALAGILILSVMPAEFWDRMSTITVEEGAPRDGSAVGRLHFWNVSLLMAKNRPLTGVGLQAFNEAYPDYDTSGGAYGKKRSVHSAWLGFLSELGVPGLALFVGTLGLAFLACRRARRLAKKGMLPPAFGHYGTALEGALVAFSVGSTFVIFQYVELLWHTIALSIALHYLTEEELAAHPVQAPVPAAKAPTLPSRVAVGALAGRRLIRPTPARTVALTPRRR
jgi:probable O-glycosylation ligase (exosortase A-associated)